MYEAKFLLHGCKKNLNDKSSQTITFVKDMIPKYNIGHILGIFHNAMEIQV